MSEGYQLKSPSGIYNLRGELLVDISTPPSNTPTRIIDKI